MPPLAIDSLGLGFTVLLVVGLILWIGLVAFLVPPSWLHPVRRRRRPARFDDHGRDRLGLKITVVDNASDQIASIAEHMAEMQARADRGRFRHATRFNENAAAPRKRPAA